MSLRSRNILIPVCTTNLVVLKSDHAYYAYIYNTRFYFIIKIDINSFYLQLNRNLLSLKLVYKNIQAIPQLHISKFYTKPAVKKLEKNLMQTLRSWDLYYFAKIKFKGKVYKITKYKNNNLKLSFGRCHKNLVAVRSLFLKKKKRVKNKILLFGTNAASLSLTKSLIVAVRPINLFTQRGLRLSRQLVYRKIGKKSSYSAR